MSSGRKRALRIALSIVMLLLLVLYARTVDWSTAWRVMRTASLGLLGIALVANLVTLAAKAVVWWLLLRPVGVSSFDLVARATVAGAALNNVLVANSGEAARVVIVARASGTSSAAVLAALALERVFDFLGYIVLLACAAFLLPMPAAVARWRMGAVAVLAALVVLFVVLLRRAPVVVPAAAAAPTAVVARARAYFARFLGSLGGILTLPRLAAALALTAVNWGTQLICYHLVARASHLNISLVGSTATLLTANVGFLVRATPGNVGVFQLVYAVTAQAMGLSKDAAVAAALLLQLIQNVPVTLLGVALAPDLVLRRRGAVRVEESAAPAGDADA